MADDPDLAPPTGGGARAARNVSCGFCGCRLDAEGTVIKAGTEAKRYGKLDDDIERLKTDLDKITRELTETREKLTAATAPKPPAAASDDDWK